MIRPLSRTSLVLDIAVAIALFAILTPITLGFYAPGSLSYVGILETMGITATLLAAALQCGGVALGRLAPGIALGAAWAGAIIQMLAGLAPLPINIAILFVLFASAAWGSTKVFWLGLASVAIGSVIAGAYIVLIYRVDARGLTIAVSTAVLLVMVSVLALGLAWMGGFLWRMVLRSRRIREAQTRAEEATAEEQERVRIARDMHDIVAHSLAVVIAQADGARYAAVADPELAQSALGTIAQTARGALSDVRMLLTQLRHRQGDGPQPTLADLETLFAQVRQAGVEPRVIVDPTPPGEPPGAIQLAVYRILQEALTNAIRHGDGTVDVRLSWWPNRVEIDVRNAAPSTGAIPGGGHGLIGMRERAQLVGGALHAEREAGMFVVRATLPIGTALGGGIA